MSLRIKQILKEQGRTQKWLAEQLEITETGTHLICDEKINVPLRRLEQIASVLGVSIVELFETDETSICCPYCGKRIDITAKKKESH